MTEAKSAACYLQKRGAVLHRDTLLTRYHENDQREQSAVRTTRSETHRAGGAAF